MSVQLKDPSAVLDYTVDWSDWLAQGEAISTSTWTVTPADSPSLTIDSETEDTNSATATVSGGVVGTVYRLTNRIVTSASRTDERTIVIRVEQR